MIVYRDGHATIICDECYRPRPTFEAGWVEDPKAGLREAPAREKGRVGEPDMVPVMQPAQPAHVCPTCQAEREGVRKLTQPSVATSKGTRKNADD